MTHLPVLIPASLLLFAFLCLPVSLVRREWAHLVGLLGTAIAFGLSAWGLFVVISVGEVRHHLGGWPPPIGIETIMDPLAAFMAILIAFIGLVVMVYARQSFAQEVPDKQTLLYPVALLLLAALTGIVMTGDLFNLYVFLEIASLSAYALVAAGGGRAPVAAFRYLILGTLGGSFYLLGIGFIYFSVGSLNMADLAQRLPQLYDSRAILAAAVLIVVGLALKMALFPLHLWLPDAYTHAPSAVTALIAPIMTKVAAYILIRLLLVVFQPAYYRDLLPIASTIGWLAVAGIIVGSVIAIAQVDLRRMLAYSSVSQIAYVGLGIGLANPLGLIGALLHILNHAFMKGCLFLVAGGIRYRTGLWEIPKLVGLGRQMPWTMAVFTLAALSMVGIPPTAGFFSKWYLILGSIDAQQWMFIAAILASSLLNAVYFVRILEKVYAAAPAGKPLPEPVGEPPLGMLLPILVLAVGIVLLGVMNVVIVRQVLSLVAAPL